MAELIWDGKYRADGKRATPVRVALPFQTVETVNESAADRTKTLQLFAKGKPTEWRNRLIWGDKKYVLPSLLPEFAGKVDLIYIDPPFNTDADFSFTTKVPETGIKLTKLPSIIEQKAYRDTWARGLDSYLGWFSDAVTLLRELMSNNATIYVQLDDHVSHYAKAILDEVYGKDRFVAEIIWQRTNARANKDAWPRIHDVILCYTASDVYTFKAPVVQGNTDKIPHTLITGPDGQKYQTYELTGPGIRNGESGMPWRGFNPTDLGRHWGIAARVLDDLVDQGLIHFPKDGGFPRRRSSEPFDPTDREVAVGDVWTDIDRINQAAFERLGYPTQKPEALLERIIKASSNEGDLVLDCFCGSGTTAATAEKLGRRWITCDLGRFAVHTARKRLLSIEGVRPFVVQNLGKYERQAWMKSEFDRPEDQAARETTYRAFILGLYRAQELPGFAWIHGVRDKRMVHVGAVDAPVTVADVKAIAREALKAGGSGATQATVDILGWEFAFELNEVAKKIAAEAQVEVRFRRIPNDALDKRAVERGDIKPSDFFELRMLSAKLTKKKRAVTLEITDFILPAEDLPADVQAAVKHWSQWIDYWAVDWDWKNDTFHNEWQTYRTRETPKLPVKTTHEYKDAGTYSVMVKVIDILGNDTTRVFSVEVA